MDGLTEAQARRYWPALRAAVLFREMSEAEILRVLSCKGIGIVRYRAGATLMGPGKTASMLGILCKGSAVVSKQAGRTALRVSELCKGAVFGMASLYSAAQRDYPTQIRAKTAAAALVIPEEIFTRMLREHESLMFNYLALLTERVHFLTRRMEELIHPDTNARVLLYIEQNARDGRLTHGLTALAQALGISRATLYRALDMLQAQGLIRRDGKQFELQYNRSKQI